MSRGRGVRSFWPSRSTLRAARSLTHLVQLRRVGSSIKEFEEARAGLRRAMEVAQFMVDTDLPTPN